MGLDAVGNFDAWNEVKKKLDYNAVQLIFREREVWWYAAGKNIGSEIDGKNERFSRPILIIRRYGPEGFLGAPLSSKIHDGRWYATFELNGRAQCVLLSQVGSFSVRRLYSRIGRIKSDEFLRISDRLEKLIFKK